MMNTCASYIERNGRRWTYDLHTIQILFEEKGWKGTKICC